MNEVATAEYNVVRERTFIAFKYTLLPTVHLGIF